MLMLCLPGPPRWWGAIYSSRVIRLFSLLNSTGGVSWAGFELVFPQLRSHRWTPGEQIWMRGSLQKQLESAGGQLHGRVLLHVLGLQMQEGCCIASDGTFQP